MAAYAALVSLFNDLELIPNHQTHSFSFDNKQLSSLSQTVESLIDFVETYDSHGCTRGAAEALESRIASAAQAAHDVVESHIVDQIHARTTLVGGRTRSYFLLDLQRAMENMEFVKRKAMRFQAKSRLKAEQPRYSSAPSTSSTEPLLTGNKKKNAMVGFDSVLLRLLDILTGEPSHQRSVVPIVGMGGIGKTTLARNAYDHSYIQEHFDVRVWATISQVFSIEETLMELLYGVRNSTASGSVGELGEGLHKKLWGRRYLVVLDDMWNERAWDEVQMYLPDNGNGSRVVVTSRLSNLATTHLSSSSPFYMDFLDEDKSWELFCGKAFGGAEEDCPVELEDIGKKIVRRCRGLPLSIVVIGGHLRRSSRTIEYWEELSNSINPISSLGRDDQCLEILRLSYQHLPACLKTCFLCLGVFKEDSFIDASELISYWVGEGFIKPKKGLILEEVAEDYLEDLIDRNLVLVREMRWNGKVKVCCIHDVVRELCLNVSKKEKFIFVVEDTTGAKGCEERRFVVPAELSSLRQHRAGGLELPLLLRSLICQGSWLLDDQLSVDLRLLRLSVNVDLDPSFLLGDGINCPTPNFRQVNLRCLVFYTRSAQLPYFIPSPISLLWNLQTLRVRYGFCLEISLPFEIWELPQLRRLQVDQLRLPDPLPSDGSKQEECIILTNLHTLIGVVDMKLTEEVCKRIPNIKKLGLSYRTLPGDLEEASLYYCLHNLGRLNKLESLDFFFFFQDSEWSGVFQSLTFPSSLVKLTAWGCHLKDFTKISKSIPQLRYLGLWFVWGSEWDLAEEEFPHLRILEINFSSDLIHWNASSSNFPVLEELHINYSGLSEIPFDFEEIPTLKLIHLTDCSVFCAISAMRIVTEREDLGNQDLQLMISFLAMEELERFQKMVGEEGLSCDSLSLYHSGDKIKAFF